jgi:signal transduction histidine kinase
MLVKELESKNSNLNDFVRVAAHDLKSPLHCITMLSDLVRTEHCSQFDNEGLEMIGLIRNASTELSDLIDGIMKYSLDASLIVKDRETIDLKVFLMVICGIVDPSNAVCFNLNFAETAQIFTNKTALEQIFINIFTNSIKYNDKDLTVIDVSFKNEGELIVFNIEDNGPGIQEEDRERIFEIFQTASKSDKYGKKGSGIGLATVKSLVNILGGKIEILSSSNQGLKTVITLRK